MKNAVNIIVVILVIALLAFAGYKGYQAFQDWRSEGNRIAENKELKLVELLNDNQEAIVKLHTQIATVEKRIAADTLKETTIIEEEAKTYNAIKEELVELRKNEEENKEEIEALRIEYEERIEEYRESPDKIMVNTGEDKIVIYEDEEGNLVSLDSGVKITRHRDAEEVIKELKAGATIEKEEEKEYRLSINAIYDIDGESFHPGLSYQLFDWRKFSLNVTGYDFDNIKGGLDLCYNVSDNILIGAGMNLLEIEDFKINTDKYYLKAGIEFDF